MSAKYKIFYTDGTSLLWKAVAPNGDPRHIPPAKRVGVHSIIQEFQNNTMREVLEEYHYWFSTENQQWIGVGVDGLLDVTVNCLPDIRCIMHGRTLTTDKFWEIKQEARTDKSICGGQDLADVESGRFQRYTDTLYNKEIYYVNGEGGPANEYKWTQMARHRMYDERVMEETHYGHGKYYH